MSLANKPIHAVPGKTYHYPEGQFSEPAYAGMTLLEHYAGLAMAACRSRECSSNVSPATCAKVAMNDALALIAELEKVRP